MGQGGKRIWFETPRPDQSDEGDVNDKDDEGGGDDGDDTEADRAGAGVRS